MRREKMDLSRSSEKGRRPGAEPARSRGDRLLRSYEEAGLCNKGPTMWKPTVHRSGIILTSGHVWVGNSPAELHEMHETGKVCHQ
jgi:hypothetical protein